MVFSVDDPKPGFPTNFTGIMGLFAVAGTGLLKAVYSSKEQRLDFSPQDITVKCMAYYAMKSAEIYAKGLPGPVEIPVFHTSMGAHIPISYTKLVSIVMGNKLYEEAALEKNLLLPGVIFTESRLIYLILVSIGMDFVVVEN